MIVLLPEGYGLPLYGASYGTLLRAADRDLGFR